MEAVAIFLSVLYPFVLIYGIKAYYRRHYNLNKHKISDAEIFKLMGKANHFLSAEQLAAVSPLSLKEAQKHLMHLSFENAVRRYQDRGGGIRSIYCLQEALPEAEVLPISIQGLSDEQIVDAVVNYCEDYQVTIAELSVIFGLDTAEAKTVLKRLKKKGLVTTLWKGFSRINVIKKPLGETTPKLKVSALASKISTRIEEERIRIPDADVIQLAIDHEGRLTPTLVCLKLKIPMRDAQQKLDALYDDGALILDAETMAYQLRDRSLLD